MDLNNSSVRRFQQFPGMYPTMAGKIVLGGFGDVDEVLNLDLSERQRELFAKYRDNFTVTPSIALNEGDDRINDGQYRRSPDGPDFPAGHRRLTGGFFCLSDGSSTTHRSHLTRSLDVVVIGAGAAGR